MDERAVSGRRGPRGAWANQGRPLRRDSDSGPMARRRGSRLPRPACLFLPHSGRPEPAPSLAPPPISRRASFPPPWTPSSSARPPAALSFFPFHLFPLRRSKGRAFPVGAHPFACGTPPTASPSLKLSLFFFHSFTSSLTLSLLAVPTTYSAPGIPF